MLTAVETTGTIRAKSTLELDEALPFDAPTRVRVIVLFSDDEDLGEKEWMKAASKNEVFEFLGDAGEDIYTLADGKPLQDEI